MHYKLWPRTFHSGLKLHYEHNFILSIMGIHVFVYILHLYIALGVVSRGSGRAEVLTRFACAVTDCVMV